MKQLPKLLMALGLWACPFVLAAEPAKHGEPGHDHARDHGQEAHQDHGHNHADDHAHAHDNQPHHGGIVAVVDHLHHELVMAADGKVSLYAEGLPAADALQAVKVRLTILQGKEKQEADMVLAADDNHRFDATVKLVAGDKVVAMIQLGQGQSRLVRFEIPAAK